MSLEEHFETMRPGDLSEAKQLSEDVGNQLGNAAALVSRAREEKGKDIAQGYPEDAALLEKGARDLEAAIVDVRKHLEDASPQEHLSLALHELSDCYLELLEILRSADEEPEPKKVYRPPDATLH